MGYDNRHRTFLQAVMQGGSVHDQEANAICTKIFNERIAVSTVARSINDKLSPLAMALKSGICEITGEKYWSVVSTTHEESITIPSEFSTAQRSFLRSLYSEIIGAEDGSVSTTDCLNLSRTIEPKISMGDAESFLKQLVQKHWLHIDHNGYCYMGIRSILEMMPYFRMTYQDNFHNCSLCREVIFHGQKCENCDKMFHNYCIAKYITTQKQNKCPQCKSTLNTSSIPDEIMNSQSEDHNENHNEDEPMDVSDDTPASQSISKSRRPNKRTRAH